MKCDTCVNRKTYIGAGPPDDYSCEYCAKGHWEGEPLFVDYEAIDPPDVNVWDDCKDFQEQEAPSPA